jgi:hypothetical protein
MKISVRIKSLLILVFLLCVSAWIFESKTRLLRRTYDDAVLDNRNHFLSCDQLPSEDEVRRVMQAHQDMIERIEKINPGLIGVEIDASACPGKADILFWYGTHLDRLLIESIVDDDTFYGIPYRFENR